MRIVATCLLLTAAAGVLCSQTKINRVPVTYTHPSEGKEMFVTYCAVCHGQAGNGQGVVAKAGFANVRNLHEPLIQPDKTADGSIFNTLTHGKGLMGSYGDKLTVNDRWAVIAWVRVLQKTTSGVSAMTMRTKRPSRNVQT